MSTSTKAVKTSNEVPLQVPSRDIWDAKYRLKDRHGRAVDKDVTETWDRVARALAVVEGDQADAWLPKFRWALENGAIPAGRIMSNAGAEDYKPAVSLINCTVSRTIRDSMHDILDSVVDAGMTLKAGCGIGYEFSTLRHKGAFVFGAGAGTNGPLAFMDIYDKMCFTVASAGGRRGAQMGTFDVGHPDVRSFIEAKREAGRLRQFNLSLLITDEFIEAVKQDTDWPLAFPLHAGEKDDVQPGDLIYRDWPVVEEGYTTDDEGRVACRIVEVIKARELWDTIMKSTYDFAEPGFILIDQVNRMNNNWFCEEIRATNPCGEQPLPPEGACLLGSVNLTRFVIDPFGKKPRFDWDRYRKVVAIFTRMLDNVVEISGLPLAGQRSEIEAKRRHGMGFLGLGSTLTMLKIPYGSPESLAFTEEVSRNLALEAGNRRWSSPARRAWRRSLPRTSRSPPRCCVSGRNWPRTVTKSATRSPVASCMPAIVATCRRSPSLSLSWWRRCPSTAHASLTIAPSHPPAPFRCRWATTPPTASSPRSRTATSAMSSRRARRPRSRWKCAPSSWPPIVTSLPPTRWRATCPTISSPPMR
ncbi:NrdJa [Halomonas sp. BC04]|nr:NrdJa [Halomonas sp. BC04]